MRTKLKENASACAMLLKQSHDLYRKSIAHWRQAWQQAISVQNPRRGALYRIYDDIMADSHLNGAIEQRKHMTLSKNFYLSIDGKQTDEYLGIFNTVWFKNFMEQCLDSIFYGYSLIELGKVTENGFEYVKVVPREHVCPEYGVILKNEYDPIKNGIKYTEEPLSKWCIAVGSKDGLGKLLSCCPHAISKRNAQGYWDEFGQLFGMPVRIAKTASHDKNEIAQVADMLKNMGPAAWGLFPEGTELDLVENGKGDAFNVFDRRIDRANSEISKCILGQTMTLDSGSSYSQSEVHLTVLKNIIERDADMVRDIVNTKLIPLMVDKGILPKVLEFNWNNDTQYTSEQQLQMEQMLLSAGYEIDPQYFVDKYGVPIKGRKQIDNSQLKIDNSQLTVDSFFA